MPSAHFAVVKPAWAVPPIGPVSILVLVTYAYFWDNIWVNGEPLETARHTLAAQGGLVTLIYARHGTD